MSYLPIAVKSINALITTGASTLTPTFLAANSLLTFNGITLGSGSPDYYMLGYISGNNSVTVTNTGPGSSTWRGTVTEFYPNFIKSAGSGFITIPAGNSSAIIGISAIDTNKTVVSFTGFYTADNGPDWILVPEVHITSSTSLGASISGAFPSPNDYVVGYSYLEFR